MVRRDLGRLWAIVLLSSALYGGLARLDAISGPAPVLRFLGIMGLLFGLYAAAARIFLRLPDSRAALGVVVAGAFLFRLALLPAGLPPDLPLSGLRAALADDVQGRRVTFERFQLYDDDVWRYLWDGHVLAHRGSPYGPSPTDPSLDALAEPEKTAVTDRRTTWADVRDNVNYPQTPTVYPPLAQGLFWLSHRLAPGSLLVFKLLVVGLDLLAALFIAMALRAAGRPATEAALYAWNPLVVKVFAGSGHFDALAVALLALLALCLVKRLPTLAAAAWSAAVLAKLAPLVLLPLLVRRLGLVRTAGFALVAVAGLRPMLEGSSLAAFAGQWQFNAGLFHVLKALAAPFGPEADAMARLLSAAVVLAVLALLLRSDDGRPDSMPRVGLVALGALLLVGPAVMPWYVTWLLPFAVLSSRREWLALSGLVCLAFVVMIDGVERPLVLALEHGLMLLVILGGCVDASIPRALHRALGAVRPRLRPGLALVGRPVV